ncbi:RFG1 [Candida margitis]|uniref:RFG1 n=1 Tax=Candida margitis TaxID=1775924 RepID=UPI002227A72C|nr:RFG1 [Candida margitis]KAI5960700.1 RFG1 [Candida margitis]
MSTAIYYNHNMHGDDLQSVSARHNNTLPSLAQIMPTHAQQQSQQQLQDGSANAASAAAGASPVVNGFYPQQQSYVQDAYSQASTSHTTPSASYADHVSTKKSKNTGNSARSSVSSSSANNVNGGGAQCICKNKSNKIPRPRNAFILFRQKYHQAILDEGTVIRSNPEVSRELGRRWRALPPAEKEHWTKLAEEEKKNHALKYPNYKYEPKRNGKNKNCLVCKDKPTTKQIQQQQQQQQAQANQANQAAAAIQAQRHHSEAALAAAAAQQQMLQHQQQQQQQQQQVQQQQVQAQQHDQYQNYFKQQQQQLNNLQGYPGYIISNNPYLQNSATSLASSSTGNLPLPGNTTTNSQYSQIPSTAASSMGFYDQDKLSPLSATYTNNPNNTQVAGAAGAGAGATTVIGANGNVEVIQPSNAAAAGGIHYSMLPQQGQPQLHHPGVVAAAAGANPAIGATGEYQLQGGHPQPPQGYGLDGFHQ